MATNSKQTQAIWQFGSGIEDFEQFLHNTGMAAILVLFVLLLYIPSQQLRS